MDFVRSNFGTNEPLPVEHRPKSEEKSVQLAEGLLYQIYFLKNPYFRWLRWAFAETNSTFLSIFGNKYIALEKNFISES